MKLGRNHIKKDTVNENWPLFVNKRQCWWSASITLDNSNAVLTDF